MLTTWIAAILRRDLSALRREIEAYADERDIWRVAPGISNCAGTLALHLGGNIQFFVGAVLAGTGYVRDRDAEVARDRKSTRLNSSHGYISYAVFCLKKKKKKQHKSIRTSLQIPRHL